MRSIRKFVGCVRVAAGLGAAALALGLTVQVATANVSAAKPSDLTSLSPACLAAVQAARDALVADRQEDADEFHNPNPSGEPSEDSTEAAQFAPLISNLRTACAAEIAAETAEHRTASTPPSVSAQCLAAAQAFKAYARALWTQHTAPTAAQQAQLRQLGQAVKAACGWSWTAGRQVGLGGYPPPSSTIVAAARASGDLQSGCFRVVALDASTHVHDFASLAEARKYADDVASESDYDDLPPAAYVFDSRLECVDIGIHYAMRKHGLSAWESYQKR